MARVFSGTASTTPDTNTIDGASCERIYVQNNGAVDLLVNVPAVNGTGFDTIKPGDTQPYETSLRDPENIKEFTVKTASGTAAWIAGVTRGNA